MCSVVALKVCVCVVVGRNGSICLCCFSPWLLCLLPADPCSGTVSVWIIHPHMHTCEEVFVYTIIHNRIWQTHPGEDTMCTDVFWGRKTINQKQNWSENADWHSSKEDFYFSPNCWNFKGIFSLMQNTHNVATMQHFREYIQVNKKRHCWGINNWSKSFNLQSILHLWPQRQGTKLLTRQNVLFWL